MQSIAIYTSITQGYDRLRPPPRPKAADFVAFLDRDAPGVDWEVRRACAQFTDPCRNAKVHKILSHLYFPQHEYTIWIDGSVSLNPGIDLARLVAAGLGAHDLALFRHRSRSCIYQEAEACIRQTKDDPAIIRGQMAAYRMVGHPEHGGLNECMVLIRRNTPAMARLNEAWFAEIVRHSRRDQLSFNYVSRKLDFQFRELPGKITANEHFTWHQHAPAPQPVAL